MCDLTIKSMIERKRPFVPRRKIWKLRDSAIRDEFCANFKQNLETVDNRKTDIESKWSLLKGCLLDASDNVCGWTKGPVRRRETWWWNRKVDNAIKEKRRLWKEWKAGSSKEPYLEAKRRAKSEVYAAKRRAEEERFPNVLTRDDQKNEVFKIAKQMAKTNQDIIGEKCVKGDTGDLAFDDSSKKIAWESYYSKLLNEEFEWDRNTLSPVEPIAGPAIKIERDWVKSAISRMKSGKAAGPSGIVSEMLNASGDAGIDLVTDLVNSIISQGVVPADWEISTIVNCYKGKGDALERGNYRGLKMLDQIMKVLERVVERLIREKVNIDDMQFGFMPGKGTIDAIFIIRQLQEKYLQKNKKLYFAFIDLEKAFDRVPREVVWWAMRKLGVDEWIVSVVMSMYENARSRVRVNGSFSKEFEVKVGVHQGS